jgi:anaerobic magnesium-protoporphyrin IX monomethyl ester cyclase
MKILLVVPKIKSLFGDEGMTVHPHIGVAYLSSFLKSKGVEITIFDAGIEKDISVLYRMIDEFRPALIGVTIFSYCYGLAYDLVKKIKEYTKIPLVAGGPHIGAVNKNILEDTQIDFAVAQEGEFTLLELLEELGKENPDFSRVKGLIWRDEQHQIIENRRRAWIEDLDALPFPDYDAFGISRYACSKQRLLPLITSRGCPFGCNYCSVRLCMGQNFRARSAGNVFAEIKHFYDDGWRSFDINDDCFTLNKERAEEICDMIIAHNLQIRFELYNGIRVDTVTPHLLKKLKAAGCYFISYGCEAGNDKVLQAIKKGITLQQVRDAVNWTNEIGIPNAVNFIIGHKEETYQDALDTLNFAKSLSTNFVNFYNLLPYPGTESFAWARQHARFLVPPDSFLEQISYRDNQPIFETDYFTAKQKKQIVSLGFDLYKKRILSFRLGKRLGGLVYWLTKLGPIDRLATQFALSNPLGKAIYTLLARKSFFAREEDSR